MKGISFAMETRVFKKNPSDPSRRFCSTAAPFRAAAAFGVAQPVGSRMPPTRRNFIVVSLKKTKKTTRL